MINPPPTILEAIADTPLGRVHRARLADGGEVAAVQVVLPDGAAIEAAVDRLRRVSAITDPALAPVLGWWVDGSAVWYLTELEEGLPFSRFPASAVLSPQQSVAISLGVLQGLSALHDAGLSHGAVNAANVRVDDKGRVRLAGHPLAMLRFPSDGELAAELRSAGRLVCDAFGIPVEKTPGPPRAIEHAAPALVVAARSIANGTMGHDVKAATTNLRDTAGPLASPERLALGVEELGALVGGREPDRGVAPLRAASLSEPIPAAPGPVARVNHEAPAAASASLYPATRPPAPRVARVRVTPPEAFDDDPPAWKRLAVAAGALALLAVLVGGGILGARALFSNAPGAPAAAAPHTTPQPTTAPSPSPTGPFPIPVYAPAAAGSVKAVNVSQDGACAVGSNCTVQVQVVFNPQPDSHPINWTFKIFDRCSGVAVDQAGGTVNAQGGWNNTIADTVFNLPGARGQIAIVAISTAPDQAASQPLLLGPTGCAG